MNLFESESVASFLRGRMSSLPNAGRGELRKMGKFTGIHSTTMSQIAKGDRTLLPEQGAKLCEYFGFSEAETKYFLCLVQIERAGSEQLKKIYRSDLMALRKSSRDLQGVVRPNRLLSDEDKAVFYSNWYYSGISILISIHGLQTVDALVEHTDLSRAKVKEALTFLVSVGLCVEKDGRYVPGHVATHLEASSPLVSRHHGNWRVRAMDRHPSLTDDELAYTCPMSLSREDAARIRKLIIKFVKEMGEIRDPSPCELAYCLNLDWFKI